MKPAANAVHRTNILYMLETHLPDERRAIAERRASLEAELSALSEYDSALERIERAMLDETRTTVLQLARKVAD